MIDRREALLGGAMAVTRPSAGPGRGLQALVAPSAGPGVLGVAVIARGADGRVQFAEAAGTAVTGAGAVQQERPFTLEDPVRVASISKLVLMAGFMSLVEQGAIGMEDDVSGPLDFRLRHPAFPEVEITPAMLASHTSGLRDSPNYPLPLGRRLVEAFTPGSAAYENGAWFAAAVQPPGRFFTYANTNFAVLAQLIERLSGERFDRFMSRHVFQPLGLDCGYNWSGVSQAKRNRASAVCRWENGAWTPGVDAEVPPAPGVRVLAAPERPELQADDYGLGENGWVFSPQGGLRASARDLDALARLFAAGGRLGRKRLLSPSTVRRMQTPLWTYDPQRANGDTDRGLMRAYGMSVHALTGRVAPDGDGLFGPDSRDWRGHLGQAYGLLAGLWWNVRNGRTLVYVINGTPGEAASAPGRHSAFTAWEEAAVAAAGVA
ncbi:MAG: beta-lactamase family protein [Proteobacteria bacterium]|nr:beta-lactamase family protein [Pseudomonadota bacterium]MBW3616565.1 beta-lactamase family protein [Pseudomonadota bacterium]